MEANRKQWNEDLQALRGAFRSPGAHSEAMSRFLSLHARVHAGRMSGSGEWSFEDEVWRGLSDEATRRILPGGEHSIAWLTWHTTRIEDVTMNVLAAGGPQLFLQEGWFERLKVTCRDTGNASDPEYVLSLSEAIDIQVLRDYRAAVGRRTRQVVLQLDPGDMKKKVSPSRLQEVLEQGAVTPAAAEVLQYWGGLTLAGLLLMPPTRHQFIHLNEALRIKQKLAAVR